MLLKKCDHRVKQEVIDKKMSYLSFRCLNQFENIQDKYHYDCVEAQIIIDLWKMSVFMFIQVKRRPLQVMFCFQKKDFVRVSQCLENFLSMHTMTQFRAADLKREMDARDSLCYPLLQWYVLSMYMLFILCVYL